MRAKRVLEMTLHVFPGCLKLANPSVVSTPTGSLSVEKRVNRGARLSFPENQEMPLPT